MDLIAEIYRTGAVTDQSGRAIPVHSHIDEAEGKFLFQFIRDREGIARTLEVGCAYGLSSLHITKAIQGRSGAHHVIVDAFQSTDWSNIGISNLRRAGISFFELREELSELALPRLLEDQPESFDLVFIDGWHTFDHTLLDLFYANRLIRIGGYIIVDDCHFPSVAKAVDYLSNYPCYRIAARSPLQVKPRFRGRLARALPRKLAGRILPRNFYDHYYARAMFPTMIALQKVAPDNRDWRWHVSF